MIFGWWLMVGSVVCAACEDGMGWVGGVWCCDEAQKVSKSLNPEVAGSILAEAKRS